MCGIGGVIVGKQFKGNKAERVEFVKALAESLLVENQRRGRDASGIAVFNRRGWQVHKKPKAARDLVKSAGYQKIIRERVNNDTLNIILHTRAATQGHQSYSENNHPIITEKVIGVHNGMVWDDALTQEFGLDRKAEVDSEAIFCMLDKFGFGEESDTLETEKVKWVSEQIAGMMTIAFVPKDQRNVLYISKKDNPVTLAYVPHFELIFFASQKEFVQHSLDYALRALFTAKLIGANTAQDIYNDTKTFEPQYETIYRFDALMPLSEQFYQDAVSFQGQDDRGYYSRPRQRHDTSRNFGHGYGSSCSAGSACGDNDREQEERKRELIQRFVSGDELTDAERALVQDFLVV